MHQFVNIAKRLGPQERGHLSNQVGYYDFDQPSGYLRLHHRFFQAVISQTVTRVLTGAFHDRDHAVHAAEGGCNIVGAGELILGGECCYWDALCKTLTDAERSDWVARCGRIITEVVLGFDPMEPFASMLAAAMIAGNAELLDASWSFSLGELDKAVREGRYTNPFGGNSLWAFWKNHIADDSFWLSLRPYIHYVQVTFEGMTDEQVAQQFEDQDLVRDLKDKLHDKARKHGHFVNSFTSRRDQDELRFWISGTKGLGLEGWVTREQLDRFLAG